MRGAVDSGTGGRMRNRYKIYAPMGGKTGTTNMNSDGWFVGYTPSVVTGVWVGNDDNTKMGGLTGGTVPAIIWRDVMKKATEPYGNEDFGYPDMLNSKAGKNVAALTNSKNSANYHDDSDTVAPTEDVVQVNSYTPQQPPQEQILNPQGQTSAPVPSRTPVPQMSHPPIPTAGQDF